MTTSDDFTTCHKGTGRCCKKVCIAFSLVHISFSKNDDEGLLKVFKKKKMLFIQPMLNSNFSTKFSFLLNILRSPSIS